VFETLPFARLLTEAKQAADSLRPHPERLEGRGRPRRCRHSRATCSFETPCFARLLRDEVD